ncbi:hypothetical protein CBR_g44517 [Chara braunii]|uniref:Uncharacterized protein n=1 Tax=Chara braunii TaxID=69332 RepID=A0A388LXS9_CHABU|nr:hypothetical protein CBR_g44517 [Chara braunii]|eukprot:GBG87061.1 hypothetical protein CBR_g44517 [Chara braunii]
MLRLIEKEGGLEVSLPRMVRVGEYLPSWWGMLIGTDTFVWIESGFDDERKCAMVRVTLYASAAFWIEHGIELALGHGSLFAKPLRVVEAAAAKSARGVSRGGEEQVLTRVEVRRAEEFELPSASLRVILREFLIEKSFGGQARVEAAAEASLRARDWEYGRYTCELIYDLYLDLRFLPSSQWLRNNANTLDVYASSHDPNEGNVDWEEIRAPYEMWDEKTMWYMLLVFVCEGLSEEVYTLMLKSQTWEELEASLKLRLLEDGVECRLGKGPEQPAEAASTQGELSGIQRQVGMLEERLARLEEARHGERKTFEGASDGPAGQGEAEVREDHQELLLHKKTPIGQVCALERDENEGVIEIKEERESSMTLLVIVPEPRGGPIGREAPSAAGWERQRNEWWPEHWEEAVCDRWGKIDRTPQGDKERGVMGEKEEPEPPKLTKAQWKARNRAQRGQGTSKGQGMPQGGATPQELGGKPTQAGPPQTKRALYGPWTPYGQVGTRPIYNSYLPGVQGICLGPQMGMMPPRPPAVQFQPALCMGPLQPPIPRTTEGHVAGGRGQNRKAEKGCRDEGHGKRECGGSKGGPGGRKWVGEKTFADIVPRRGT